MKNSGIIMTARSEDLLEGLFGQVLLHIFEILPYLHSRAIFPDWEIRARHYGMGSHSLVMPGVLDLAYDVGPGPKKRIDLLRFGLRHRHVLGNDWPRLAAIWNSYFRIPDRINTLAAAIGPLSNVLGIHFRGNDKPAATWDTNPISHNEYLVIIRDFIESRPEFQRIFLATDDFSFHEFIKDKVPLEVVNLGEVKFHKLEIPSEGLDAKTDRAMLDCVLLSRCGVVLQTSSALAAFTKILNPELETYRVAASKRFYDAPYFPVAYIPWYRSASPEVSALVDRLMEGDWTLEWDAHLFAAPFAARPCWPSSSPVRLLKSYLRGVERWPGFAWVGTLRIMAWKRTFLRSRKKRQPS
jgi:hypothetical protein